MSVWPMAAAPEPWTERSKDKPLILSIAIEPDPFSQTELRS